MGFDPQKLFIGIVDLFSILLPGAALAYLSKGVIDLSMVGLRAEPLTSAEHWLAFLFVSYLIGHLVFLLSSKLDDYLYDPLRKGTYQRQIERLQDGKPLSNALTRRIANWVFGDDADRAVTQAVCLKSQVLAPLSAERAINAFQWCKARLSKEHPEGLAAVQRFEADSKFFRSFVVALAILAAVYAYKSGHRTAAAICIALLLPVTWRYLDQRFKATQQAYWFIITLEGMKDGASRALPKHEIGKPTHAGGVVFCKEDDGTIQYLIIQASKNSNEWVLPKGHIEPAEDPRTTAVREVKEETGYWARVKRQIGDVSLGDAGPLTTFYLMELAENKDEKDTSDLRETLWLGRADAIARATFPESQRLIAQADDLIKAKPQDSRLQ